MTYPSAASRTTATKRQGHRRSASGTLRQLRPVTRDDAELAHRRHHRAEVGGGPDIRNRLREQVHGASAYDQRQILGQLATQRAYLLSCNLAGDAAVEEQDGEADPVRARGATDFLRRYSGAERQAVDALGKKQELEDREAELVGIVRRCCEQDLSCVPSGSHKPRDVAQKPLREVGESQLLEILHLAAHYALVHRLVQWNQRLLQEAPQALPDQKLGEVVLQFADTMLAKKADRGLDLAGQRHRILDRDAEHRLQRRVGERYDCAGAPALGQQLLDQLEPRDLVGRIYAVAEAVARGIGKAVPPLPHVELLAAQTRNTYNLADMQGAARIGAGGWNDDRVARVAPTRRRLDQDAHERFLPILCATSIKNSPVRLSLTHFAASPAAARQPNGPHVSSYCPKVSFGPSSRFRNKDFQRRSPFSLGPNADDDFFRASTVPAVTRFPDVRIRQDDQRAAGRRENRRALAR